MFINIPSFLVSLNIGTPSFQNLGHDAEKKWDGPHGVYSDFVGKLLSQPNLMENRSNLD